jgi:hypothetical protein
MRKFFLLPLLAMIGATLVVLGMPAGRASAFPLPDHHDYPVKAEETIQKSFAMPAGAHKTLEIDNVFGAIEVIGGGSNEVRVVIAKTIRADSNDGVERARREVTLDVDQHDGALKLYVNGPFRCHCDDCRESHESVGYRVKMDFTVQVPSDIDLRIKTVNEGNVKVSNVTGDFSVHNVNGRIEMNSVAGSGTASTVNGPVKVSFRKNPSGNSDFHTINGDVELRFAGGLSADFRFKTFNGGIYTDFPVTALPARNVSEEHRGGKLILRADRTTGARIGSGGPEIKVENLNGDIRILENNE